MQLVDLCPYQSVQETSIQAWRRMASQQPGSGACSACHKEITCCHVNFLASTPADDAATSPPKCKHFFTEFWAEVAEHFEGSKTAPVYCPVHNFHEFPIRPAIELPFVTV
jgi:hypothetical protein